MSGTFWDLHAAQRLADNPPGPLEPPARMEWTQRPGIGPGAEILAHDLTDCRIIELGCGAGHNSAHLAAAGARVIGIDSSEGQIRRALAHYGHTGALFHHCPALHHLIGGRTPLDAIVSVFGAIGVPLRHPPPRWHPALGTPLNPATYDYAGAVLFNAHAGKLWDRFTTYLRREISRAVGLTVTELREQCRISFAKVAEFQKRGLVHFHAVIRLDGPEGSTTTPPPWATVDLLTDAIRVAVAKVSVTITSDATRERELRWGAQLDAREITRNDATAEGSTPLTDAAVAGYVAKYATKSTEGTGTIDRPLTCTPCKGRGRIPGPDGFSDECTACDGTGLAVRIADLKVASHVRQMIRTCWDLGSVQDFAGLKLTKWAHMLGFRGHFSTKSRRYSITLGAIRGARRTWQTEQARIRAGHPVIDPATTLVVSDWRYLATGYAPGEELLAETVRDNRATTQRLKREGDLQ